MGATIKTRYGVGDVIRYRAYYRGYTFTVKTIHAYISSDSVDIYYLGTETRDDGFTVESSISESDIEHYNEWTGKYEHKEAD